MNSYCMDVSGYDGEGHVQTWYQCDGYLDQYFYFEGGRIRNSLNDWCLDLNGSRAVMRSCSDSLTQQWNPMFESNFFDIAGTAQINYTIENASTGNCLDVSGNNGKGDIYTAACTGAPDQLFYPRQRGGELASLYMKNVGSNQCISGGWDGRDGNLRMIPCGEVTEADYWVVWLNGEITSKYSRWCWDIDGYDGYGWVGMWPCQNLKDQMWTFINVGGNASFQSKDSGYCLEQSGNFLRVAPCTGSLAQQFNTI